MSDPTGNRAKHAARGEGMKPYYDEDGITIYHGDCREVLPTLADVDLVFTSPPYNLGVTNGGGIHGGSFFVAKLGDGYADHDDAMPQHVYDAWQTMTVAMLWETLSDRGAIFYNHKPRPQASTGLMLPMYGGKLPLRQIVIWDRGTGMNFSESFFLPKQEWILIWAKPAFRLASRDKCAVGDVWRIPVETGSEHPAPFPLKLPATAIEATAPRLVLDPFSGSGTTLRAAKDAGVSAIGIELSERYCEIAAKRLAQGVLDFGEAS